MGCGASGLVTVPGFPGVGLGGQLVIGKRRLSMRPHSLETRILQIEKVDTIVQERSSNVQPEAPFSDPQLGIKDLSSAIRSIEEGVQFVDPDFPADQTSLGLKESVRWLRLRELGVDQIWTGRSRGKVKCGGHHNSWLAEALAIASMQPRVLDKVFVEEHVSRGYVILRLWRFGKWEKVTVDDRIPVPCCITSSCPEEIWPAVIEKAFAKLHGSYAALAGGDPLWGLEDLTGGIAQRLEVPSPGALGQDGGRTLNTMVCRPVRQAIQAGAIVSCQPCAKEHPPNAGMPIQIVLVIETRQTQNGYDVKIQADDTLQGSALAGKEGQWVDVKDFVMFYTSIIVTTFQKNSSNVPMCELFGCWETGISSGGSRNNLEKFAMNPQYILTVNHPDEHTTPSEEIGASTFLIALMQEHRRSSKITKPLLLPIACFIYKAEAPNERLSAEYFLCVAEEASTGPFVNRREVSQQVDLEPGHYILIPATWYSSQQGAFLLRIYALKGFSIHQLPQHLPTCAMLPTWVPVTEL